MKSLKTQSSGSMAAKPGLSCAMMSPVFMVTWREAQDVGSFHVYLWRGPRWSSTVVSFSDVKHIPRRKHCSESSDLALPKRSGHAPAPLRCNNVSPWTQLCIRGCSSYWHDDEGELSLCGVQWICMHALNCEIKCKKLSLTAMREIFSSATPGSSNTLK